jgi:hypothetical protein
MKTIQDLFDKARAIDRPIVAVINYAADAEELLAREISEYEITDSLARHYERFMTNLDAGFKGGGHHEVSVWVSGFYGSGKSSFTKYLGFALDPQRTIGAEPFRVHLANQLPTAALRQQLTTLAKNFPATVIMIDLAAVAAAQMAADGISRIVYHKVLEWAGYSRDEKISLLELMLERDGRKGEFIDAIAAEGFDWSELQNDLLAANAVVGRIACQLYPKLWKDPASFSRTRIDSTMGEDERLREVLSLIERRTGSPRVIFILDEVGQFIEGTDRLITNLQGLAENLKNIGKGQAWLVATAQQTLPVTGPLFKLQARFPDPLRIDIESTDIREITYRRLLRKSPEASQLLEKLFQNHAGAIASGTQLKNTRHVSSEVDAASFSRLYPFLPQHFNILMELLRSLARSTGGIGLRSTLKVIQDGLIDLNGMQNGKALAKQPIGRLATADLFFDTLRNDIERANRPLVETVNRVRLAYGGDSLELRVAKTIAVLQLVEGFPVSAHNVGSMLFADASAAPLHGEVSAAVQRMLEDTALPLAEIEGSLRFMSEAISGILAEEQTIAPTPSDYLTILNEVLRDQIFSPEPGTRLEGTKQVKAQVKLVHGTMPMAVTHSREDVEIHLELVPPAEVETKVKERLQDSNAPVNRATVFLVAEELDSVRETIRSIYRCEEIHRRHRTEAAEREVTQYVSARRNDANKYKAQLETMLRGTLLKGKFVFRGSERAVSSVGTDLKHACNSQLDTVAREVFTAYSQAPQNADTSAAEKLLQADLSKMASALDPCGIVEQAGIATRIRTEHPALISLMDHLRRLGDIDGRRLLDDFNRAPFGWSKDTTRYLAAGLFIAQSIRIRVGGQWLEAPGPRALEAFKSNIAFQKIDLGTNDKQIPAETLNRAAKRLKELTGDNVLPMPPKISAAVLSHFPRLRNDYTPLAAELKGTGLAGVDRAELLSRQIGQALDRDASDAPLTLGAEESSLAENLRWARLVRGALQDGLGEAAREVRSIAEAIDSLPRIAGLDALISGTESLRAELNEFMGREDFHSVGSEIRARLTELQTRVRTACSSLRTDLERHLSEQRENITDDADWARLLPADRASFAEQLEIPALPEGEGIPAIRNLLNIRMECGYRFDAVRTAVAQKIRESAMPSPPPAAVDYKTGVAVHDAHVSQEAKPGTSSVQVKVRRRYGSGDLPALHDLVHVLGSAAERLKTGHSGSVEIDVES